MSEVREATADLVESRPAAEDALRDILAADESGPWTFDDVAVDSGTFGEIVATGIVEDVDDGYRVADHDAVRAVLDGSPAESTASEVSVADRLSSVTDRSTETRTVAIVGTFLLAVVAVRVVFSYGSVFRVGEIVLGGNDAYLYRYWGEELLRRPIGALDPTALGSLPEPLPTHDVLMVVAVWWAAALLGGTPDAVGTVLAWYPVVAALVSATLVYLITVAVSGDRRAGIASVALLAITPVHAFRTTLGFGDHHAFDYIWIALAGYALVYVSRERIRRDRPRWGVSTHGWLIVATLAVAVTAQVTAWRGGPLLVAPLGLYALAKSLADVRADRSPLSGSGPLLVALAGSGLLTLLLHVGYGWLELYRALAPALLAVGTALVVVAGELSRRWDLSARQAFAVESAVGTVAIAVAWIVVPAVSEGVGEFLAYMQEFGGSGIAETASLFSGSQGSIVAPLLLFGFTIVVAFPILVRAPMLGFRDDRPAWLAVSAYGWYLFVLAIVQIRFAGQLSLFTAVFAGIGFVWLAAWVDITSPVAAFDERSGTVVSSLPRPDRAQLGYVFVLFLLVGSLGFVQTPIKIDQVNIDDAAYETATWIDDHAATHDREYPRNYVFSQWGRNRMYNYFVSGQSREYGFALRNYAPFLQTEDPAAAAELLGARPGYIVTQPQDGFGEATMQALLHDRLGSAGGGADGTGRFRAVFLHADGPRVFMPVSGARVRAAGPANSTITVSTPVSVGDTTFNYTREFRTNQTGDIRGRVAYGGRYDFSTGSVNVTESSVRNGSHTGNYLAHWAFESPGDGRADEYVRGHHGTIDGGAAVSGPRGTALAVDASANDSVAVDSLALSGSEAFTVCSWARVSKEAADSSGTTDAPSRRDVVHIGSYEALLTYDPTGQRWITYFQNETGATAIRSSADSPTEWTHLCGRYDGDQLSLWVDGERVGSAAASGVVRDVGGATTIGGGGAGDRSFDGAVDDVHVYDRALSPDTIGRLYGYGTNATS